MRCFSVDAISSPFMKKEFRVRNAADLTAIISTL